MPQVVKQRATQYRDSGVTLLEILIAVSLLGIGFTAIFSGFSTGLRTIGRVDHYAHVTDFAVNKLNELVVDPRLGPGQELSGVSDSGLSWRAKTELADQRPGPGPDQPIQLMRVELEVSWKTSKGLQSFALQTLKLRIPKPGVSP
jgi:prepilin-type N-terminal cleavage/methylation domain-containing protein